MCMVTTPARISPMPIRVGKLIDCLKMNTEISVVHTIPMPDHTAYATPSGIVLNAKERK